MSFIQCDNCGARFASGELTVEFPDIPDLAERVSPGEAVPCGECNDCGALCHEMLGEFTSIYSVVKFVCGPDQVLCLNDRGQIEHIGTVMDNSFEENDNVDLVIVDEKSVYDTLGDEWAYSELFDGLSDGLLVLDSSGILSRKI